MGIKFAMPASTADMPTLVEGIWVCSEKARGDLQGPTTHVKIAVLYWDGAVALQTSLIDLVLGKITGNGGTVANWNTIVSKAVNPSDYDDVVEELKNTGWGAKLLWGHWYSCIGQ